MGLFLTGSHSQVRETIRSWSLYGGIGKPAGEKKPMNTKRVVLIATLAALYAVLTVAIAPISYGPIQFRVSEVLKVFVLFDPCLVIGIGIGTFIANLASPFAGPWDLVFMPITDILGGLIAYGVYTMLKKKSLVPPMIVYSLTTGLSVGLMLAVLGVGGFWLLFASVSISELVIMVGGLPIVATIFKALEKRGFALTG